MSVYKTLRRMKKNELQEEQILRVSLERELESLEGRERALAEELAAQNHLVREEEGYRVTYGDFLWRHRLRKEECEERKGLVFKELDYVVNKIHRKFGELKKMEILADRELEREKKEYEDREQKESDEMAVIEVSRRLSGLGERGSC